MSNLLEIRNLCKTYTVNKRLNHVLRNVNFDIARGEMVAVMGPSGSGKSTLLYTVSGMDRATAGEVYFESSNIADMGDDELASMRLDKMGFVFQQMYMLANLSILDNILLPAMQSRKSPLTPKQKKERALELMHRQGIADIAENGIDEVSGGQLQRACVCRSIINSPAIVFADEPTGALNRAASDEVMETLCDINREGTTVMLVTHDIKVAARCSRVLYLVDGSIKGEYNLSEQCAGMSVRDRERSLSNKLAEMGW